MLLQRVTYINKTGQTISLVLEIIGRRSKNIIVKNQDGNTFEIPRRDIESIEDPEKNEKDEKHA